MFLKNTIFTSILCISTLQASEFLHSLSNQGYTGLINTPNASVMNEGDFTIHFDNQFDNSLRGYDYSKDYETKEDYIFGAGVFPYIEVQGRLSEAPGYHRDLSANLKVEFPYKHKYLPNFAIGAQDIGSAANHYGNYYGVMDKEFWFLKASLGYGHSTVDLESKKRMDGLFGGLEVKTFDWLYLMLEDDSIEQFAGLRIHMPKSWSTYFKLNTLISTNISDDYKTSISVNLTFPLYENIDSYSANSVNKYTQDVVKVQIENNSTETEIVAKLHLVSSKQKQVKTEKPLKLTIEEIKEKLVELGIENITLGTKDHTIYVSYENTVFLFNDLDAMGTVVGLLTQSKYKQFILEPKRSKTTLFALSGDLNKAREFYANPTLVTKNSFTSSLKKSLPVDKTKYKIYVNNVNDTKLKLKVEFSPVLRTFVGNEFGLFNYMLWLRTKLQINLYKGIDITAVGDIHIKDSEIDDHRYDYFMKLYERSSHMESVMLHFNSNLLGGINTLSLGTFEENFAGGVEQYIYNYENHTFKLKAGYFKQFKDGDPYKESVFGKVETRYLFMLKYSYLFKDYDTFAEINGGEYWNQDIGFDLKLKRFFGDVAVYLVYEQNNPYLEDTAFSERTDRYAGLGIEIPLTLRHTPSFKHGQILGTNAFNYRVRTTVAREDGTNSIVPGGNYNPPVAIESENYFYNRNRLQLSYIKTHAFRFVESYEKYAK